jgi:hypothetical protein
MSWTQAGITTSGIDRHGDATVTEPDYLAPCESDDGCFEQPSSVADALSYNHQDNAGMSGGALQ